MNEKKKKRKEKGENEMKINNRSKK